MISSAIIPRPLARLPWRLIFLVTGIAAFGLVVLYSAAGGSIHPWAVKQAIVFGGFLVIAIAMSWMKESTIKAIAFPLYGITLVMLIGVEGLGFVSKGAKRWLDLGPIRLQPSEFMKPAIVLTLARFYELVPAAEIRKWRAIWPAVAMLGVPALLILVQPEDRGQEPHGDHPEAEAGEPLDETGQHQHADRQQQRHEGHRRGLQRDPSAATPGDRRLGRPRG